MATNNSKKQWKRFGNKIESNKNECFYCGEFLNDWNRTVDHVTPKSQGGILSNDNKVFCCKRCNQFKANHTPESFLGMVKFVLKELDNDHEQKTSYYRRLISNLGNMVNQKDEAGKANT